MLFNRFLSFIQNKYPIKYSRFLEINNEMEMFKDLVIIIYPGMSININ